MTYNDMPVIIPVLATAYLLTVYILLILAERTAKSSRYIANSGTAAVVPYTATDATPQSNEVDSSSASSISEVSRLR
jgi:hypothetical protein